MYRYIKAYTHTFITRYIHTCSPLTSSLVAVQTEQRQGLYKEYTVEKEAQKVCM